MLKKRIFISSVQAEFASERERVADYIRQDALLKDYFVPFLFEELPAQDQSAQKAYLSEAGQVERLVLVMENQTLSRQEIMDALSLKGRDNFRQKYLVPAMEQNLVSPLFPEELNRPDQKYHLTEEGQRMLKSVKEKYLK